MRYLWQFFRSCKFFRFSFPSSSSNEIRASSLFCLSTCYSTVEINKWETDAPVIFFLLLFKTMIHSIIFYNKRPRTIQWAISIHLILWWRTFGLLINNTQLFQGCRITLDTLCISMRQTLDQLELDKKHQYLTFMSWYKDSMSIHATVQCQSRLIKH